VTEKGEVTDQVKTFRMWNYDAAGMYGPGADPMYICIPVYLGLHSSGSYLIFYENSFEANFTFGDVATAAFEGGALRYYVTAGSPAQLLERYTELTGRSPLPPRWAFNAPSLSPVPVGRGFNGMLGLGLAILSVPGRHCALL
jgi:alpha-glucosidase (family GH31 glycosyl hydrolase)